MISATSILVGSPDEFQLCLIYMLVQVHVRAHVSVTGNSPYAQAGVSRELNWFNSYRRLGP